MSDRALFDEVLVTVAEGFCPKHLTPLAGDGFCDKCQMRWSAERNTVRTDSGRLVWKDMDGHDNWSWGNFARHDPGG